MTSWIDDHPLPKLPPEIYIVIKGGCVSYVSSTSPEINVTIIDLDDLNDGRFDYYSEEDLKDMDASLEIANKLERIW